MTYNGTQATLDPLKKTMLSIKHAQLRPTAKLASSELREGERILDKYILSFWPSIIANGVLKCVLEHNSRVIGILCSITTCCRSPCATGIKNVTIAGESV